MHDWLNDCFQNPFRLFRACFMDAARSVAWSTTRTSVRAATLITAVSIFALSCAHVKPATSPSEIERLLAFADRDHDHKITVEDFPHGQTVPVYSFMPPGESNPVQINGVYELSNLLQELTLQARGDKFNIQHVFEKPSAHISRAIRERYWDGLTRRFDEKSLGQLLPDTKINSGDFRYL